MQTLGTIPYIWKEGLRAKSVNRWAQEIWMCWLLHAMEKDGDVEWGSVTHSSDIQNIHQTPGLYLKLSKDSASKGRCWAHSFPSTIAKKCGCEEEGAGSLHRLTRSLYCQTTPEVVLRSPTTRKCTSTHTHIPEIHNGWQRTRVYKSIHWLQESEKILNTEDAPRQCREIIQGPRTKSQSWNVELFIGLNESHWTTISESDSVCFPDFQPSSRHLGTLFGFSTFYYFGCLAASWLCQLLCDSNIPFRGNLTVPC